MIEIGLKTLNDSRFDGNFTEVWIWTWIFQLGKSKFEHKRSRYEIMSDSGLWL